jgi:chemotaxis protein methyltransferase CheR
VERPAPDRPPRPDAAAGDPGDRAEVDALLDHLFVRTGLDFRLYARRSLERRLRHLAAQDGLRSVAALRARTVDGGDAAASALAQRLCIGVTSLFRDPPFWAALRRTVVPRLRDLPSIRAWCAGCSSGEEAFSLAILLHEEGLSERARIYATDVDEGALARARAGALPLAHMPEYSRNYLRAGGARSLSAYYAATASAAVLGAPARRGLVFSRHNLATDAPFQVFQLVLCRNVLIYFDAWLQRRAHEVLRRSLAPGGVLGLGLREATPRVRGEDGYTLLDAAAKLYLRAAGEGGAPGEGSAA